MKENGKASGQVTGGDPAFERCILCGGPTRILKSTPVSFREHYIPGCGQLCSKCAWQMQREDGERPVPGI